MQLFFATPSQELATLFCKSYAIAGWLLEESMNHVSKASSPTIAKKNPLANSRFDTD